MLSFKKEIEYTVQWQEPKLVAYGIYRSFKYYVYNYGTHPCAYIDVGTTSLKNKNYDNINIQCHGDLTYSDSNLNDLTESWYIGWDYAHAGDYIGYYGNQHTTSLKIWSIDEIIEECIKVIDQIIKLIENMEIIIRCSECKYHFQDAFGRKVCMRTFNLFPMEDDDFCSYGERER